LDLFTQAWDTNKRVKLLGDLPVVPFVIEIKLIENVDETGVVDVLWSCGDESHRFSWRL